MTVVTLLTSTLRRDLDTISAFYGVVIDPCGMDALSAGYHQCA